MSPDVYTLSLETWQYFVTLTYRSEDGEKNRVTVPKEDDRRKMLFAFLRSILSTKRDKKTGHAIDKVHWKGLLWAAREERGELNGRYHFHILVSGFPPGRVNAVQRFAMRAMASRVGFGHSDVRVFDASLSGVQYVLKGLDEWSRRHANAHEMCKFDGRDGTDREVILADAFVKKWADVRRKPKPSEGSGKPDISAQTLVHRRELVAQKTKETPAYHGGLYAPNMHPAGVSFVI
ncbi:hypothetical protein [Roseimicrobium sp. ORNL1]|uniref:hypothetical protein n=1 Tax=Roseimicrobium sp. ORNL1 TaxID=2711231 RepID=UPI0013E1468C|nr:hypothetical protein [Roseimicrobium sp. ORNL1]QIF02782.1 hypothetical protein G5S37_15050 [Roseimicrobium sp. ORNL1]